MAVYFSVAFFVGAPPCPRVFARGRGWAPLRVGRGSYVIVGPRHATWKDFAQTSFLLVHSFLFLKRRPVGTTEVVCARG